MSPPAAAAASAAATTHALDLLRQQEGLRAVIESISGELELRPLLTRIVESACDLLGADRGAIGLVDEDRDVIRTEAVYRMPPGELGAEMAPGVGLAGAVLRTREPVLLQRYGDVPGAMYPDVAEDAVLGVPILWGERMIGSFGIGALPPRRFSRTDIETLALFARHAAIAIENARRYEREQRRNERLALIARIGRIVAANLELSDLLQRAADAIHELLGYPYVAVLLPSREVPGGLLLSAVAGGDPQAAPTLHATLPPGAGVIGAAARERRPILVREVSEDPRYLPTPGTTGIRSELAVPILLGDTLLGVLNAESQSPLGEDDRTSLRIIADQLAVAIENARLYTGARRALDEARLLYQTSRRISTAMGVEEVVRAYLEQVAGAGDRTPYACSVAFYDRGEDGRRSAVRVLGRWSPGEGITLGEELLPVSHDDLDPPLDAGQTVAIRNVAEDPRVPPFLREVQLQAGRPALALIPLLVQGARTGVVVLSHDEPHDWPEEDLNAFQATAAQLAAVLESRRQQEAVQERGQRIAALEERQRIARDLHDSVTQLLFSMTLIAQSLGGAFRRDPDEGTVRVARLLELSRAAHTEMRALLADWRSEEGLTVSPPPLTAPALREGGGLVPALARHLAGADGAADALTIRFDARGWRPGGCPPEAEEALYRIAQEAVANAVKHAAGARSVAVRLYRSRRTGEAVLRVEDDGAGFEPSAVRPSADGRGMGLNTMRGRAEGAGGTLRIRSAPGKGATVEARIPPIPAVAKQ